MVAYLSGYLEVRIAITTINPFHLIIHYYNHGQPRSTEYSYTFTATTCHSTTTGLTIAYRISPPPPPFFSSFVVLQPAINRTCDCVIHLVGTSPGSSSSSSSSCQSMAFFVTGSRVESSLSNLWILTRRPGSQLSARTGWTDLGPTQQHSWKSFCSLFDLHPLPLPPFIQLYFWIVCRTKNPSSDRALDLGSDLHFVFPYLSTWPSKPSYALKIRVWDLDSPFWILLRCCATNIPVFSDRPTAPLLVPVFFFVSEL